ncbi:hypothetical protein MSG28_010029 [Choristoneura fumiferana]|uniref:Uncharacterized protein n=1 Tax=Choristoneura fumiferana TaxID=7141 RepID=A0ACC0KK47_CHOFU|nr:hypothetical protein MSG28_010029 [Choristoneura fumiferana]
MEGDAAVSLPCTVAKNAADMRLPRVIQALGVSWHAKHFVCGGCKKELGGGGFMEQNCRNPVTDSTFSVMDNKPLCGKCA